MARRRIPSDQYGRRGFDLHIAGPHPSRIKRDIEQRLRKMGFAAVVALTWTGKKVRDREREEIPKVFDNPTAFTRRSPFLEPATKAKPYARVWLINEVGGTGTAPADYLLPSIEGGWREPKPSERSLRARNVISRDEFIIPAKVRLNKHGNVTKGTMQKIMAGLGGFRDTWQNRPGSRPRRTEQARKTPYFVATIGGTKAIWERLKYKVKPLFIIVKKRPSYPKRYDFIGIARAEFRQSWPEQFRLAKNKYAGPKIRQRP